MGVSSSLEYVTTVPRDEVLPYIQLLLEKNETTQTTAHGKQERIRGVVWLARRINIRDDSLQNALEKDRIDFDLVDLIFCRLGGVHLWHNELDELYQSLVFREQPCKSPLCTNTFHATLRQPQKLYCTVACRKKHCAYRQHIRNRDAALLAA